MFLGYPYKKSVAFLFPVSDVLIDVGAGQE